jgi:hypothetical protein
MGLARAGIRGLRRRAVEDVGRHFVGSQEGLERRTEFLPTFAGLFEETGPLLGSSRQGFLEQRFFVHGFCSGLVGGFFTNPSSRGVAQLIGPVHKSLAATDNGLLTPGAGRAQRQIRFILNATKGRRRRQCFFNFFSVSFRAFRG